MSRVIGREAYIDLLVNSNGSVGAETEKGFVFRANWAALDKTLRLMFGVAFVNVVKVVRLN